MTHFKWCGQFKMLSEWENKIHFSEIRSFSLRSIPSIMEQSSSLLAELDWNSFFDSAQPTATRRNWMLTLRCWLLDHPESSRGKLFQFPHRGAAQTHFNEFNLSDTAGPFSSSREGERESWCEFECGQKEECSQHQQIGPSCEWMAE